MRLFYPILTLISKNNITIAGDLCLLFYVPLDSTSREVKKFRYIPTTLYNYCKEYSNIPCLTRSMAQVLSMDKFVILLG